MTSDAETPPGDAPSAKRRKAAKTDADPAPEGVTADAAAEPEAAPEPEPAAETSSEPAAEALPPGVTPARRAGDAGVARTVAWVVLVIGLVAGTAALTWPLWSPWVAPYVPFLAAAPRNDGALEVLAGRVQALEKKAQALEAARGTAVEKLESERATFAAQLKTLTTRMQELESAMQDARGLIRAADSKDQSAAAAQSLQALSQRLAQLEEGGGRVDDLAERLKKVEQDQATAPDAADDQAVKQALAAMSDRLKRLEATEAKTAGTADARAVILATAQLRDSVRRGLPFDRDLQALKAVAGDNRGIAQAIAQLEPHAAKGVATLADLRNRFAALAGTIVAAGDAGAPQGWVDDAVARLRSLVKVRRVGDKAAPGSLDALVQRIDSLLAAGDLATAVETVAALKGKAAEAVAGWRQAATARLVAERAVANLHVQAVSLLAPDKTGG